MWDQSFCILRDQSFNRILWTLGSLPEPHFLTLGAIPDLDWDFSFSHDSVKDWGCISNIENSNFIRVFEAILDSTFVIFPSSVSRCKVLNQTNKIEFLSGKSLSGKMCQFYQPSEWYKFQGFHFIQTKHSYFDGGWALLATLDWYILLFIVWFQF